MNEEPNLSRILDDLIEGWTERGALDPLGHLLLVYPLERALAEEWHQLDEALQRIRDECRSELDEEELRMLNQAMEIVRRVIDKQ